VALSRAELCQASPADGNASLIQPWVSLPDREVDHLLIGGGIAGATCASTLREEGATGSILLVSRELDAPYHRPPITKGYLRGDESKEQSLILPAEWWDEHDVELLTRTSAMSLDLDARTVKLSNKQEVAFGQALLATGAMVRRLGVDGAQLDGIHYLRALGNADALRRDVEAAERVVLVGGSYIGCEAAASLTELGKRCTIVMQEQVTFERSFGLQVGGALQAVLESHGIEVLPAEEVEAFEGAEQSTEGEPRVSGVRLESGATIEADVVVAGVGAIPDVMLAKRSGLEIGELGGVRVDRFLRTSAPSVFAAGDMCEYDSPVHQRIMRIEHEEVAAAQGATAARNMLGHERAHATVPYFFSDLSNWVSLEYVGPAQDWDEEVIRGSLEALDCSVWYLQEGRVGAALSIGRSDDLDHARRLISGAVDVTGRSGELGDESRDLSEIG
jgi:3-phenylpropionate/trans-cinnamate dioxygenase ferredoxin reductase component